CAYRCPESCAFAGVGAHRGRCYRGRCDHVLSGVEAYGRRGRVAPVAHRTFSMRDYGRPLPEFVDRFGPAYKSEIAIFVECVQSGKAFPTTHLDGLRAQEVIAAAMQAVITRGHPA